MACNKQIIVSTILLFYVFCTNSESILLDGYAPNDGGTQLFTSDKSPYVTNVTINNLPHMAFSATVSTPQGIFIIGGSNYGSNNFDSISDVTVFVPSSQFVYSAKSMKYARSMHAAVSLQGILIKLIFYCKILMKSEMLRSAN
jgi:hypothetical protein